MTKKKYYFASMYPGVPDQEGDYEDYCLPDKLALAIKELEEKLGLPVWLMLQDGKETAQEARQDSPNKIGPIVSDAFFQARHLSELPTQPIALVIDSLGGQARSAYELAMLFRRHCVGFTAIIPRHAKSAATLLTLGADEIVFNVHAELGPLDVQIWDPDREEWLSGLDEVKTLERLHASAMEAFDRMVLMMLERTGKKIRSIMPMAVRFSTQLMQPMMQRIDLVRFTQMSRLLKVAEEYAKRLLEKSYGGGAGSKIASRLVEDYPEHGFPIYSDEMRRIGLRVADPSKDVIDILERITLYLPNLTAIGRIDERETDSDDDENEPEQPMPKGNSPNPPVE